MNLRKIATRAAVAGVSTALAAGGLVTATSTIANAAEATGDYSCSTSGVPIGTFPLSVSVPLMPPSAPAGMTIDPLLSVTAKLTVPTAVMQAAGIDGGSVDDFGMSLGSKVIGAPLTVTDITDNGDGSSTVTADGINETFTTPRAGTYEVKLPESFTFSSTSGGNPGAQVLCTTDSPVTLSTVALSKQASTMTAKSAKTAKGYKVTATVKNEYSSPTGKVTTKVGTKKVSATLKKGKAVLNLPKSAKGKKITLTYGGDGFTQAAKAAVKVK